MFPIKNCFHAYAFCEDDRNTVKTNINPISLYIIRRGILCWVRIWSQKKFSPTHFWDIRVLKNLRGRTKSFLSDLNRKLNFNSKYMHILIFYQSQSLIWKLLEKWTFCNNSRINGHNRSICRNALDIYNRNTMQKKICENFDF